MSASARVDWFRFRPVISDLVPVRDSPCRLIAVPSRHRVVSSSPRLCISSYHRPVSPPTGQPANRSARQPVSRHPVSPPVRRSPVSFRFPLPDPLFTPSIPHRSAHISHSSTPNPKNNLKIFCCFLRWLTSRYRAVVHSNPRYIKENGPQSRARIATLARFAKTMLSSER